MRTITIVDVCLQGALIPASRKDRPHVVYLLVNQTWGQQPNIADWPPPGGALVPDAITVVGTSPHTVVLNMSYTRNVLKLPDDAARDYVNLTDLQLAGLPQGPNCVDYTSPDCWALLLWSIDRYAAVLSRPLVVVALWWST